MSKDKQLSKDVELLDRFIRWFSEKMEGVSEAFGGFLRKVMPSRNVRQVSAYMEDVEQINALEAEFEKLSQEQIQAKIAEYMADLKDRPATEQDGILDGILQPVFALVREAAKRTIGLRHYDVQLIGGIVLHRGGIAEMATGEGKTLVATLPVALNALAGRGVFVVTVNDYLAKRDRDWMAPVFEFLGLTVGAIQSDMDPNARHPQYACDITYGTNNEYGFDYLRDNMKSRREDQVQKHLHYADHRRGGLDPRGRGADAADHQSGMPEAIHPQVLPGGRRGAAPEEADDALRDQGEGEQGVTLTEEGIEDGPEAGRTCPRSTRGRTWTGRTTSSSRCRAHNAVQGGSSHYVKRPGRARARPRSSSSTSSPDA